MITRLVKIEKYTTNILSREIFHMYIHNLFTKKSFFHKFTYLYVL